MRIGSLVRILTGLHANRIALVENSWDSGNKVRTVEVFVPGSSREGGSLLTYPSTDLAAVGAVALRQRQTVRGERLQWCEIRIGEAVTTLAVTVKEASGEGKIDTPEIRRRALWSSNTR